VTTGGTSNTFACMPGCYPPPALSNYSSATDLQLKGPHGIDISYQQVNLEHDRRVFSLGESADTQTIKGLVPRHIHPAPLTLELV
jgi:hypothetical protein